MKRAIICSECAFETSEIEVIGHAIKEHWYCAYYRPEYGHVTEPTACEYFEAEADKEDSQC